MAICHLYIFLMNYYQPIVTMKGGANMTLSERCIKFIDTLGVPITKFCQRIQLSRTAFFEWRKGNLKLSDSTLDRIEKYISQFGF